MRFWFVVARTIAAARSLRNRARAKLRPSYTSSSGSQRFCSRETGRERSAARRSRFRAAATICARSSTSARIARSSGAVSSVSRNSS